MKPFYNRREFIKQSTKLVSGIALATSLPSIACGRTKQSGRESVSVIQSKQLFTSGQHFPQPVIVTMLDEGLMHATNYNNPTKAWQSLFNKNDKVALKVNCIGKETGSTKPELCFALAECLNMHVNIPPEHIIIFDRTDLELQKGKYQINKFAKGIKVYASPGFSDKFKVGSFSTSVSSIISDECTALINIPLLKTHPSALLSLNLKNHYGSIPKEIVQDSTLKFHADGKFENIVYVNTLQPIKEKTRLCIADGLIAQYDKGPRGNPKYQWPFSGIIMGTDPVAVDTIGLQIINTKRSEHNMKAHKVKYLQWAEEEGLGIHNLDSIDLNHKTI